MNTIFTILIIGLVLFTLGALIKIFYKVDIPELKFHNTEMPIEKVRLKCKDLFPEGK